MSARIEFAQPADLPSILKLLNEAGLPEAGLACRPGTLILTAKEDGELVGCAALELYGERAVLRSVAVAAGRRKVGLGGCLVDVALDIACRLRLGDVYLLTEGAESFFAQHGFEVTERAGVPDVIAGSVEFTSCCCANATAMVSRVRLGGKGRPSAGTRIDVTALSLHDLAPVASDRSETRHCH